MERQPLVAGTCQGCSVQWEQDLCPYHCSQARLVFGWGFFLGFNICLALISGAEGAGMRGMQA